MTHEGFEHLKPKVEPTSGLISPLYDKLERAKHLINCAYCATFHDDVDVSIADSMRTTLDVAMEDINRVYVAMHDMIAWAE